jgi:sigma-B regulation protein RsbU (phosphoserine phosphatase)
MLQAQFKTIPPFPYLEPKQFYRRLEEVFQRLESHRNSENFARAFLDQFAKTLADLLRTESIQLYDRYENQTTLLEMWGMRLPNFHEEIKTRFEGKDRFPWFGEWNDRMVAILPVDEAGRFVLAFFTHNIGTLNGFVSDFSSYYSALHYSLLQNRKRLEMQGVFEQARSIQMSLLPSENPSFCGFDIAAKSVPAAIVGGDVFDFHLLSPFTLAVTLGDASGHGFVAALQARDVITGLRLGINSRMSMVELIQSLNRVIHQSGLVSRFVSLVHGELFSGGEFHYINAGHPRPILFHDGVFTELERAGMILGPTPNQSYTMEKILMPHQSVLLMFTDGVIEHHMEDEREFGTGQLKALVRLYAHLPASEIVSRIFSDLRLIKPNFQDDATIVCVKRN